MPTRIDTTFDKGQTGKESGKIKGERLRDMEKIGAVYTWWGGGVDGFSREFQADIFGHPHVG